MISITRSLARQLRAVFLRALRLSSRDAGPNLLISAGPDSMRVQARNTFAAVEHHMQGEFSAEQVSLPFAFLADCAGTKAEPVTLEQESSTKIIAQWSDKKIPQLVKYDVTSGDIPDFPAVPAMLAENDGSLWRALAAAMETTDPTPIRLATDCVQLRGSGGKIIATDSQQLLVQAGFSFPWEDDLFVPRTGLFACRDMPADGPLHVGRSENWLTLQTGPWTFHLAIDKERRYPTTESHIQSAETAITHLQLAQADAEFLADALQRLPSDEDDLHHTVTVDLNGQVIVRAQGHDSKVPTELVLSRSSASGENLRFTTNRNYLARAVKLGFRELHVYGTENPVQAQGPNRVYVWAPLGEHGVIKPSRKAVRIDSADGSPQAGKDAEVTPPPRRTTMAVETTLQRALVDPTAGEDLGIPLLGVLDLILDDRDGPLICDFGTSSKSAAPFEVTHEIQLSCYAYLYRQATGNEEGGLEIRSLIKTKVPKIEFHRYEPRNELHFRRLFAVVRAYLDDLDAGRFVFRPGLGCAMCDYRDDHCRSWEA